MSARNKLENKYIRKATRGLSKIPSGTIPIGRVPQEISANILSNPKQMRLSGKSRRRLQRGRGAVVAIDTKAPGEPAVKVMVKFSRLSLAQLLRRQAQAARRASTAKHIISDLSPGSMFAIEMKAVQTSQLSLLRQITAEIRSREHS